MALNCKAGTVTITTGAVGTTFDVTGLSGFDTSSKKVVFFFHSGSASAGFAEGDLRFGCGVFINTTTRRAHSAASDHANGTSSGGSQRRNDACIAAINPGGTVDGLADIDSIITDGFRLIVDDQFTTALVVGYVAIWGSDLEEVGLVDFDTPGATGNQDLNFGFAMDTGQNDKAFISLGNLQEVFNTANAVCTHSIGVAAGETIAQAVMYGHSVNAAATMNTWSYSIDGECCAVGSSGVPDGGSERASVSAWLSTGVRLNWTEIGTVSGYTGVALKGGRYAVGDILSQTGTSDTDETVGFTPKGILAFSHNKTKSTSDTGQPHNEMSVGAASGATERWVAFVADQDNVDTSDIGVGFQDDAFYGRIDVTNATKAVIGLADLVSFGADKFTFKMDDADPDQAFIPYLAMGDAPAAAASVPSRVVSSPMRW